MSGYGADFFVEAHFYAAAMESWVVFFTIKAFSLCDLADVCIVRGSLSAFWAGFWTPAEIGNMPISKTVPARFYWFYVGGYSFL